MDGSNRYVVLAAVMVGTFMAPLDASIVNIALPALSTHFSVPVTTVQWVATAYLLTTSSLLLSFGRLGDIWTHKRLYLVGFVVFTAGSLMCGLAWSISALIAFRVLQALGAGMILSSGPAILARVFPARELGRAYGLQALSVAAGLTIGPPLGGALVSGFGWPWVFFINVPVGVVTLVVVARVIPKGESEARPFDFAGGATLFGALLGLLLALAQGESWGWTSPLVLGLLLGSVVLGAGFLLLESRLEDPVLDLALFKIRNFTVAAAANLLSYVSLFMVTFLMPFFLIRVMELEAAAAGLVLVVMPLTMAVVAPASGFLSESMGSRLLTTGGLALSAAGIWWLSTSLWPPPSVTDIVIRLFAVGLGMAIFQAPNTSSLMGSAPRERSGVASGMVATMRNMGMAIGIAVASAIIAVREPVHAARLAEVVFAEEHAIARNAFALTLADAARIGAVVAAVGVIVSALRLDDAPTTGEGPDG